MNINQNNNSKPTDMKLKDARDPYAQQLPNVINRSDSKKVSIKIVHKLLSSLVTITLSEALQVMPKVQKLFSNSLKDPITKSILLKDLDANRAMMSLHNNN